MKLKNIKIHNFFTFAEADVELGPKTYFITGENLDESSSDSNGSGKSLFCQSIVWCLFGDLLRRGNKKDDVIGENSHYTSVILELEKDGKDIVIERYRNHDLHNNNSRIIVDGKDLTLHKDNDKQIEKILNIDSKIIYHCAYTDKRKQSIVDLTPAKLKEAVSEILQSSRYDEYIKAVRSEIKDSESNIKSLEGKIRLLSESEQKYNVLLENIDEKINNSKTETEAKKLLLKKEKEKALESIEERINKAQKEKEEFKEIDIESLKSQEQAALEVQKRIEKGQRLLTDVERELFNLGKDIADLESILESRETCKICGSDIKDPKVFETHESTLLEKKNNLLELENKRTKYTDKLELLQSALEEVDLAEIQHSLRSYLKEKSRIKEQCDSLLREKQSINKHYEQILQEVDKESSSLENTKKEIMEQLTEYKNSLAATTKEYEKELKTPENLKQLSSVLSEIRVSMYNDFVYSFRDKINQNLEEMTGGDFKCTLEESSGELEFFFTSPSKNGKMMIFPSFSDGEQARISKAVALALEEMIDTGFVVDDENLSGVDDAGIKAILDFVLSKNANKTFFFVGHQRAFKDYFVGYDNIHIIKEKGVSRVERRML